MALSLNRPNSGIEQADLLLEIEAQGTPLRIDGQTETYYVLSASQLRALMGRMLDESAYVDGATSFTLDDFGLTEADVDAYNKMQQAQRARVETEMLKPLPTDLAERLAQLTEQSDGDMNSAQAEQALAELEAAMLTNLQALAANEN